MRSLFLIFIITFLVYAASAPADTPYDYFTRLSHAFLNGRLYLEENPPWLNELIPLDGKYYVVYSPMPAIILMPLSAFGPNFLQTLFSIILGAINGVLIYILMRRLQISQKTSFLITFLFAFGTNHWFLSSIGSAWYLAHIVAIFFLLLSLIETFGKRRYFLIGLLLGASFWSRTPVLFTLPFFILLFRNNFKNMLLLGSGLGVFILLDLTYNFLRFNELSPFRPYNLIPQIMDDPVFKDGFMSIKFIPRHLNAMFFYLPQVSDKFPYLIPSLYSMAIWFTTPALIYIIKAKLNKIALACWVGIIPTLFVISLWAGVGYSQFGYRFIQDVIPFLLILTAYGVGPKPTKLAWILILVSILVNVWGVILINKFDLYVI